MASIPTRLLAGVQVPDTPLISKAIAFAHEYCNEITYNHVMRSFIIGHFIADHNPELRERDVELQAVATILHDLGWALEGAATNGLISPDKRFEVDGADATRDFLIREGEKGKWDKHRLQLAWDAVALHATASFAMHKEREVKCCCLGIMTDFAGPEASYGGVLTRQVWNDIAKEFPRKNFREGVKDIICNLCTTKAETTYDNWASDFGIAFVEGYSREGKRGIDRILATEE